MQIIPFSLERYFVKHEFSARYLLSSSDCDGWLQSDILGLADSETRKLWEELRLGYTESQGLPLLRREISKLYKGVEADDILVCVPEEGIFVAMNCLLQKGDHVVCTYPGYQSLYQVAESLGCAVDKWRPDEGAGWKFEPESLLELVRPETKLLVINFPHNPTGSLPSVKDYLRIVEIAKEKDIYLFSDEMYRFLEFDPGNTLPPACELYDKAVTLFGMSKTFGLAGTRIGWLAIKDSALYRRMAEFKAYTTICSSAPGEILALIGLRAKDKIIDRHRKRIARNLGLLDVFFQKHANSFAWVRPKAGTIGFPKLLQSEDSLGFCEAVVQKSQIMLLPSTVYGYNQSHFRIGFGRENMPAALQRLEKFLGEHSWG